MFLCLIFYIRSRSLKSTAPSESSVITENISPGTPKPLSSMPHQNNSQVLPSALTQNFYLTDQPSNSPLMPVQFCNPPSIPPPMPPSVLPVWPPLRPSSMPAQPQNSSSTPTLQNNHQTSFQRPSSDESGYESLRNIDTSMVGFCEF